MSEEAENGSSSVLMNKDKKNSGKIKCTECSSIILQPNTAEWTELDDGISLPGTGKADSQTEVCHTFWTVQNMFAFENVGFCNTVDNVKYLACADCEIGPIGAHFIKDKNKFFVSSQRVCHDKNETNTSVK